MVALDIYKHLTYFKRSAPCFSTIISKLYKIHNCSSITGKRGMGDSESEKK